MGQNFSIDINKQPFYLAGRKVEAVRFVVGTQWLKINLTGCAVDNEGSVEVRLLPEQARHIARELLANADKDQVRRIGAQVERIKQHALAGETDGKARNEDGNHG
jgi:hypothetical protein